MLLFAVFMFLRGHNMPGGGFIAGLVASLAIVVQYLANGISWTASRIRVDMHTVIAVGLFFAIGTGLTSIFLGYPFMTSAFTYLKWPVVGKFEVASAMVFDLGVFLAVVGATVMILVELGKFNVPRQTPETGEGGDA
jgi:multicomponent K+:H+ antiporter subunit A